MPPADGWRQVLVTRLYGKRRRDFDHDNLVGGGKPLADALTEQGVIIDDNPKYCNISYFQEPSSDGNDYVVIKVQEFEHAH